jgi:hypothetical protein
MVMPSPMFQIILGKREQRHNFSGRLGFRPWVEMTGTRRQALSFCGYESFQAKAYNDPRYDCARPNRRRSHTRASNMGVAEGQDARSSDYRQSTRLTRTEVTRSSPRHIGDEERPRGGHPRAARHGVCWGEAVRSRAIRSQSGHIGSCVA